MPSTLTMDQPQANQEVDEDDCLPPPEMPPREVLRQHLREQSIRFVDVETIKAGLFSRDRLQLFDCVIHGGQVSWLVAACDGKPKDGLLTDLHEWERIFGPGFMAAVARVDEDAITFRTIEGEKVDIRG